MFHSASSDVSFHLLTVHPVDRILVNHHKCYFGDVPYTMWLSFYYKKSAQLRTENYCTKIPYVHSHASVTTSFIPGNLSPALQPSVLYYETRGWWRGKYVNWFGVLVEKGVVLFIGVLELLSIISGDRCGNLRSNEQSAPIAITVWVEYNDRHVSVLNSSYCSSITKRNYVLESFLPVFQQLRYFYYIAKS